MAEISSSQGSLPLSQETMNSIWSELPSQLQEGWREFINLETNNVDLSDVMFDGHSYNEMLRPEEFNVPQVSVAPQQSSLPAIENFPGMYDFRVSMPTSGNPSKASPYVHSTLTNKLYVKKSFACPFNFSTSEPLNDFSLRAMVYFCSPEHMADAVERCINHRVLDGESGVPNSEQFVLCDSQTACYFVDSDSKRSSVTVPFENPPVGQEYSTYIFKFECFTSCSGGPNRRPMSVVFTLEKRGRILGRCKVDLKICSCPYRDKVSDENNLKKQVTSEISSLWLTDNTAQAASAPPKTSVKRKCEEKFTSKKVFVIKTENEKCYKLLKGVKKYFELMEHMKAAQNQSNWNPTGIQVANLLHILTSSEESAE